ncbi:sulfotransferase [Chloroflexota bacterium]
MTSTNPPRLSPVFVVGYLHSGTTLLQNILNQHSSIFASGGETKFYEFQDIIEKAYPDLYDDRTLRHLIQFTVHAVLIGTRIDKIKPPPTLPDSDINERELDKIFSIARQNRDHGSVLPLVLDYLTSRSGKSHWLEKTPNHIIHIDTILKYVPNARILEIIRDPRAILASKKVRRAYVQSDHFPAENKDFFLLEKAYDPLWDTLSWKSAIQAGRTATFKYSKQIFTIRYEDLVARQFETIQNVCEFLDLPFEPDMLDIKFINTAYREEIGRKGITTLSVDRWKKEINGTEILIAQIFARHQMRKLSYPALPISATGYLFLPVYFGMSICEFFQRLYRRYKMGGVLFLMSVISNYWKRYLYLIKDPSK